VHLAEGASSTPHQHTAVTADRTLDVHHHPGFGPHGDETTLDTNWHARVLSHLAGRHAGQDRWAERTQGTCATIIEASTDSMIPVSELWGHYQGLGLLHHYCRVLWRRLTVPWLGLSIPWLWLPVPGLRLSISRLGLTVPRVVVLLVVSCIVFVHGAGFTLLLLPCRDIDVDVLVCP